MSKIKFSITSDKYFNSIDYVIAVPKGPKPPEMELEVY